MSNRDLLTGISGLDVAHLRPLWGKGDAMRIWAEKGRVYCEDPRDTKDPHEYRVVSMSWQEAAERALALSELCTNSSEEGDYRDERMRLQKFVTEMETVVRKAKEQTARYGTLDSPVRKPKATFVVPTEVDCW